jgi:hypothetical protein
MPDSLAESIKAGPRRMANPDLRPAPDDWLVADKASPLVNSVKNDGPKLLDECFNARS